MKEMEAPVEKAAGAASQLATPAVVGAVQNIQDIPLASIRSTPVRADAQDLEQLTRSIAVHGLLEPIIVSRIPTGDEEAKPGDGFLYELLTGNLRVEACRRLGWTSIPAIIRPWRGKETREWQ